MVRFVLVSDNTLIYDYRHFPLLSFLPSAPSHEVPGPVYRFLRGKPAPETRRGELAYAPYGLRKIEAALLKRFKQEEVAVAHPNHLNDLIKDDTEIIGVYTMDPFGLGPTTMSYYALFGGNELAAWVRLEWEELISKINQARKGKKAKLIIGGPGVWEYTILEDEISKQQIDYIFQGEAEDVVADLFDYISNSSNDNTFVNSYVTYDDSFRRSVVQHEKFLSRGSKYKLYPSLEDIPSIVKPSMDSLTEIMRGCGIGCDFCEVTLRPVRYYPVEKVLEEVKVNIAAGFSNAWLHTDEVFTYQHKDNFVPNESALVELFSAVMSTPGVKISNPTHGRISPAAAYPELIEKLSKILKAGPRRWIGVQVGLETGSEKLAKLHMPAKTLPLKIGVDGSWPEIVWNGVHNMNKYYWRPAFTVQVGQSGETDEDNWDTVALINKLSNSVVDGRPFEFTVTPLFNMPMGRIKSKKIDFSGTLSSSALAVYYASYRHLAKMAARDGRKESKGSPLVKAGTASLITFGGYLMLKVVERIAKKAGVDIEKAKTYGVRNEKSIESWAVAERL
ncbi:MAG: B12-binding domain-containing radical SAM protein [Candidatus Micrarchaeia archaeon]